MMNFKRIDAVRLPPRAGRRWPRPERVIAGIAGFLLVLAAVLEGLSRLADRPVLHDAATWALMAALYAVLLPIFAAAVGIAILNLVERWKGRRSGARRTDGPEH